VRGVSRKAELSIRSALGAQRSRIVRQLGLIRFSGRVS